MKISQALSLLSIGLLGSKLINRAINSSSLKGKVVLITGGTTGLGFALLMHLLNEGCRVAICARTEENLDEISKNFPQVHTIRCDVSKKDEVTVLVRDVINQFGDIDIVINNAGVIMVGPMESFTYKEYESAMDIMYWGIVNTTLAVLPHMKEKKSGQIVNITSVGGKVSIPHLLPYSAAKFAAVGYSEGITAELRRHNIFVSTIIPGLMRTGSYDNALFQKDNKNLFKIFAMSSTDPLITVSADTAARRTIRAIKDKKAVKVIGVPTQLLIELHHFFPNTMAKLFFLTSEVLPGFEDEKEFERGRNIRLSHEDSEVPIFREIGAYARAQFQEQKP